jgi:hypothetical protein
MPDPVRQVDVENDAGRAIEIGVASKSLRGRKQDGFVGVMPEQPLYALQHSRVIIHHKNEVSIWHVRHPDLSADTS